MSRCEIYLSDNYGHRVSDPNTAHPVLASGLTKTLTTAGTNYTLTVEQGQTYKIISTLSSAVQHDVVFAGVTGTVATDANKEWMFPVGQSGIIHIPLGYTTLNLTATVNGVKVYLAKLDI